MHCLLTNSRVEPPWQAKKLLIMTSSCFAESTQIYESHVGRLIHKICLFLKGACSPDNALCTGIHCPDVQNICRKVHLKLPLVRIYVLYMRCMLCR